LNRNIEQLRQELVLNKDYNQMTKQQMEEFKEAASKMGQDKHEHEKRVIM
jgi:hypothetical protein